MPIYRFIVDPGLGEPTFELDADFKDHSAAWDEALDICRSLSREIVGCYGSSQTWELSVQSAEGRLLFRFQFSNDAIIDSSQFLLPPH